MPLKINKSDPGKKSSTIEKRKLSNQEGQLPKRAIFEHKERSAPPSRPAFDSAEKSDRVVKDAGKPDTTGYRIGIAKQPGRTNVAPYSKTAKPPSARKKYTVT